MDYKDKTFEIDGTAIKFSNKTATRLIALFVPIFSCIIAFNAQNAIALLCGMLGLGIGVLTTFRYFIKLYWKNEIKLSEISHIEAKIWNSDIDKLRDFWGNPKFRYHFPTGFDKKNAPKVIFVYRKNENLAIGFMPENFIKTIFTLRESGINVIEK